MRENFESARHEQQSQYHEPVMPHSGNHGSTVVSVIFGIVVIGLLIVGIIEASTQIAQAAVLLAYMLIGLAFIMGPVLVVYPIWHKWYMDKIKRRHAELDAQAKADETRRANELHELTLRETHLAPDTSGNYPAVYNRYSGQVVIIPAGQFIANVPAHYAPHFHYQDTSTRVSEEKQNLLASGVQSPTMEYIVSQLKYNSLQVCLGVSLETGKPFIMDLIEGTHYRIIGGSGFGKSCEAAAILEQVTQSNDPDHLLISLLDLEHKTSRLFEDLPHVAELQIGRKRVECVATNADEVAQHFRYLRDELDRRKALSEYDLQRERFMLIYVEEFLSLKREVDPELKNQMMDDFTILALRGRKYGLYLLACAQVDYSDKSLRDAMNQFNVNMSFSVKPSAARAVGFSSNDLLKQNFEAKQRGQFVLETTGCTDIMLAPQFDVKAKLQRLGAVQTPFNSRSDTVQTPFSQPTVNGDERPPELRSDRSTEIQKLREMGWGKQAIIEKVWNVKKGGSEKYKQAEEYYHQIVAMIEESEE